MADYKKSIIPLIESVYPSFTSLEKTIGDFFIHNTKKIDFSAKNISRLLFVSEASLSRFSKKCGFKGYREFLFHYQQGLKEEPNSLPTSSDYSKQVLNIYQELLNKSYTLLKESQIQQIASLLSTKERIYVYGKGSSGLVAQEMQFRFMRLGVPMEAITDTHIMKMNSVLINEKCFVIGISVSGRTPEVLHSLQTAKRLGAATLLISSHNPIKAHDFCDDVLLVSVKENLENGKAISPQFPVLIMIDIIFAYFLQTDTNRKETLHEYTMSVL